MNERDLMSAMRFWQEVYIAVIRTGMGNDLAKSMADKAWLDFEKRIDAENQKATK